MEAALNILRKTPPSDLNKTLAGLRALAPHDAETLDVLQQRLQLPFAIDDEPGKGEKAFLLCPYNKVKDAYRSPWTNTLWPGNVQAQVSQQDEDIRSLELAANEVWEAYTRLYYGSEGAVGSVYLQKADKGGVFQGLFGIRKDCSTGSWNCAHLVVVDQPNQTNTECTYHVQSTVVIALQTGASEVESSKVSISASVARKTTETLKVSKLFMDSNHLENIGKIIENVEIDIRSSFERVHIPRTHEMVDAVQKDVVNRGTQSMAMHNVMMNAGAFKKRQEKAQAEDQ